MAGQRQDAWTDEEDLILAETVLKHIRQGSTQLAAFKEVGLKLSRTAAACGFRWNSTVRKRYEKAIKLAKEERKNHYHNGSSDVKTHQDMTINDVIVYLKTLSDSERTITQLKVQNESLMKNMEQLKEEYEEKLMNLKKENEMLKQNYQAMFEIIDKASKVISFHKDELKENN